MNTQIKQMDSKRYISSEVRFYTVEDVMKMTGWGKKVVLRIFNDPEFPSANFGRAFLVEAHALIEYFSVKRTKTGDYHWKKGELSDELRKRVG